MKNKTYITKSKAGHYTVTVKAENKTLVNRIAKIGSLAEARAIAKEYKEN